MPDWDTSLVTDMSSMFYGVAGFNQPIGGWKDKSRTCRTCSLTPPRSTNPSAPGIPPRSRTWVACSNPPPRSIKPSARGIPRRSRTWGTCSIAPPRSINPRLMEHLAGREHVVHVLWRRRVQPSHRQVGYLQGLGQLHERHVRWRHRLDRGTRTVPTPTRLQRVHVVHELGKLKFWSTRRVGSQRQRVRRRRASCQRCRGHLHRHSSGCRQPAATRDTHSREVVVFESSADERPSLQPPVRRVCGSHERRRGRLHPLWRAGRASPRATRGTQCRGHHLVRRTLTAATCSGIHATRLQLPQTAARTAPTRWRALGVPADVQLGVHGIGDELMLLGHVDSCDVLPLVHCLLTSTKDGTDGNFYCINGGTVGGTTGSCTCTSCNAGYGGASCETAGACSTSTDPSKDGADGSFYCINGGTVGGTAGSGSCTCTSCNTGYEGASCQTASACTASAVSTKDGSDGTFSAQRRTVGGTTGSCTCTGCDVGFEGSSCQTVIPPPPPSAANTTSPPPPPSTANTTLPPPAPPPPTPPPSNKTVILDDDDHAAGLTGILVALLATIFNML